MRKLACFVALLICAPAVLAQKKVVAAGMSEAQARELQASVPTVRLVRASGDALLQELADAEGFIGTIRPEQFRAAKKLRWVQLTSAGVEGVTFPDLVSSDVTLCNAKNVFGPQIADHAFGFLLALTRRLNNSILMQSKEEWPKGREGMVELDGKTALVIGVGGIGSNIAQRAHGFGMKVIGVDLRDLPPNNVINRMVTPDRLDEVLPEADVIFIAAPHTKKSEGMMGPKQFSLMKKGAYYIAMSRGKLTDTPSLVKALDEGRLAGAGLDVTDPEPLPKGHPLWKFPNVVITPHNSGGSDRLNARLHNLLLENLTRFGSGKPLINVVNKAEGF
ncbi:MAG TPA: D-2-hydroxyacid dehydrogenase [Bryobacteraceae bacterium]|nr:D-2-hydroxyacid dehydrogenase [Bryobacteraceae bacterium]